MRKNCIISLCALLLVGATGMMNARAQGSGKPTLAVFVVGNMDNTLVSPLAAQLGANLTSGGRYTLTSVNTSSKLTELQSTHTAGGGSSINRNVLAEWGRDNGISAICLVVDDVKGNDHMFYAQLIDAKDNKLSGKGSYVRTGVGTGDASWVALALAKQLEGSGRRRSAPTPARSYPAELDIEMVFVEGGTFEMGCTSEQSGCNGDEYPVHTVTLSNFNIGKYTVTRAQWLTVMKGHPTLANPPTNFTDDDQLPIERVYWDDIDTAFLPRLRALTGKNYRLLTEAEWEYAARGGKHKSTYMYSGSDNLDEVSWNVNNSGGKLHPVGQLKPNALGIYDMSGNIWEWCSDWYSNSYNAAIANGNTNPKGPDAGTCHASRGGRMNLDVMYLRVSSRFALCLNSGRYNVFGFRLALDAQ